jgi:hypothetical protein
MGINPYRLCCSNMPRFPDRSPLQYPLDDRDYHNTKTLYHSLPSYPTYSTILPLQLLTAPALAVVSFFPFLAALLFCPLPLAKRLTGLAVTATSFTNAPHASHLFLPFATAFFATRYSGQCPAVGVSTSLRGCFLFRLPGNQ